jgi:hypothetical protein
LFPVIIGPELGGVDNVIAEGIDPAGAVDYAGIAVREEVLRIAVI